MYELLCDVPGEFPFVNHGFGHGQKGPTELLLSWPDRYIAHAIVRFRSRSLEQSLLGREQVSLRVEHRDVADDSLEILPRVGEHSASGASPGCPQRVSAQLVFLVLERLNWPGWECSSFFGPAWS